MQKYTSEIWSQPCTEFKLIKTGEEPYHWEEIIEANKFDY